MDSFYLVVAQFQVAEGFAFQRLLGFFLAAFELIQQAFRGVEFGSARLVLLGARTSRNQVPDCSASCGT